MKLHCFSAQDVRVSLQDLEDDGRDDVVCGKSPTFEFGVAGEEGDDVVAVL